MKTTQTFDFSTLPQKIIDLYKKNHSTFEVSEIYRDRSNPYWNEFTFFLGYFGYVPNFIHEKNINCRKANVWFAENFKNEIQDYYYYKTLGDKEV